MVDHRRRLTLRLPGLEDSRFLVTSPPSEAYNCIAWVLGEVDRNWDPEPNSEGYWPVTVPRDVSQASMEALFSQAGFEPCDDGALIPDTEKIALFAIGGEFTHVAKQTVEGRWSSKLGEDCDIEHELNALSSPRSAFPLWRYGEVVALMQRPRSEPFD